MNIPKEIIERVIFLHRRYTTANECFKTKYCPDGVDIYYIRNGDYAIDSDWCNEFKQNLYDYLYSLDFDVLYSLIALMFLGWYDPAVMEVLGAMMVKACRDYLTSPVSPNPRKHVAVEFLISNYQLADFLEKGLFKLGYIV